MRFFPLHLAVILAIVILIGSPALAAPPDPGTGSLDVRSDPPGATVYIDGEDRGATPLTITGMAPGSHRLELTLNGYHDHFTMVTISAGKTERYTARLRENMEMNGDIDIGVLNVEQVPGFSLPAALTGLCLCGIFRVYLR